MQIADGRLIAMVAGVSILASCTSGASTAPTTDAGASEAPDSTASTAAAPSPSDGGTAEGSPFTAELKDGSAFTLAPRIADKLSSGEKVNYVFSYQSASIPLFSAQYKAGYDETIVEAQSTLPMNGQAIAPVSESGIDVPAQIAQIEALLNTDQVDCLSIEPPDSNAFTAITNTAMQMGVPVFTVGVTSNGSSPTSLRFRRRRASRRPRSFFSGWRTPTRTSRSSPSPAAIPRPSGRRAE
jgi:ribose transport system substrate-binding protein